MALPTTTATTKKSNVVVPAIVVGGNKATTITTTALANTDNKKAPEEEEVPRSSSSSSSSSEPWWWGVVFLSMCCHTLRVWMLDITNGGPREERGVNALKGKWGDTFVWYFVNGIGYLLYVMLLNTMLLRSACRHDESAAERRGVCGKGTAPEEYASAAVVGLDRQTLMVVGKRFCADFLVTTVGVAVMGWSGRILTLVVVFGYAQWYLFPREAARWLAEREGKGAAVEERHRQRGRELTSPITRYLFATVSMFTIQLRLETALDWGFMSALQLSFIYPYMLSVFEYLVYLSLNDRVVNGYSDEALSLRSRNLAAFIESGRMGLIVVTYTTGNVTYLDFVLATLNTALAEVLNRTGVLSMVIEAVVLQCRHMVQCCRRRTPRPRFQLLPLTTMGRFERVYLGCKWETASTWHIVTLVLMRVLDYGLTSDAQDPVTGGLRPALRPGAEVYVVLVGRELLLAALMRGVGLALDRWWPQYKLGLVCVRPRGSVLALVVMYFNVGLVALNSIGGLGGLAERLEEEKGGGDGGG